MTNLKLDSLPVPVYSGFVGRLPIYDRRMNLFAYDLRVCCVENEGSPGFSAYLGGPSEYAVIRASEEVKLSDVIGRNRGFLSVPDSLLPHVGDLSWPKEQVVLTVSSDSRSKDRIAWLEELRNAGYQIAIEGNLTMLEDLPAARFASVCSIDIANRLPETGDFIRQLHDYGIKLFARNITSPDQYEQLESVGFDLFQGKFFEQPKLAKSSVIPANKSAVLELLTRLHDPKITIGEVETLVSKDLTLSYKILRLINTAYFGMPKRVESIRRAVIFFGLERIKNWASIILFNAIDYKPKELMTTALVRARTCEILAEKLGRKRTESYFVAGLFSMLNAIIDLPMHVIVDQLGLSEEICTALLDGTGEIGELLTNFLAIENGACYESDFRLLNNGLALDSYTEAIRWVNAVNHVIEN